MTDNAAIIMGPVMLIVCFTGEPDLIDALIHALMTR